MLLRVPAVLYGKLGAAVQTAETHHTFLLDPYRVTVLHRNGLNRAFPRTQSTPDAFFYRMQSTIERDSSEHACAMRLATYLLLPVALKYRIILPPLDHGT